MRKKSSKKKRSGSSSINVHNRIAREPKLFIEYVDAVEELVEASKDVKWVQKELSKERDEEEIERLEMCLSLDKDKEEEAKNRVKSLRKRVLAEKAFQILIATNCTPKKSLQEAESFLKLMDQILKKK